MYGIRVPWPDGGCLWVIDDRESTWDDPKPLLFDNEEDAYEVAKSFGPLSYVKKYKKNNF